MAGYRVAAAYAKSLLDLAKEQKSLDAVFADMQFTEKLLLSSRELRGVLGSPVVHILKKEEIIKQIFTSRVSKISLGFFALVVKKHREASILAIAQEFIRTYKILSGFQQATLTTVVKVSKETEKEVLKLLSTISDKKIELSTKIDPAIIGGFILNTQDKQIDSSVRSKLARIKQSISNNIIISK
ncbi:MAG: ATP synthase F1 subunit delta [Bacteroidota bacterium]|nr:ATP synthase F1 subunit delta [Bacteroidota bacterium]